MSVGTPTAFLRAIRVRGAREHNLKSISVELPRDQFVVFTGVSGSGKSSLAFDTIFAEGQRKYMESLSSYARQFLDQMGKPDVDAIEGLPPTIAIEQRSGGHSPRSTVATTTEIWDYLRLLYARCGTPTCWHEELRGKRIHRCGNPIAATSASEIVTTLLAKFPRQRAMLCACVIRGKKGFHKDVLESLQKQGLVRARVNGKVIDIRETLKAGGENPLELGRYEMHDIDAVVDRIAIEPEGRQRISESVETALRLASGNLTVLIEDAKAKDGWSEHRFSEKFACSEHPQCAIDELAPRLFSFNSPHGACRSCAGLGTVNEFDEALVVPDSSVVVMKAFAPFLKNGPRMNNRYARHLRVILKALQIEPNTPYSKLTDAQRAVLMHGTGDRKKELGFKFDGVLPSLRTRYDETENDGVKERLHTFMSSAQCPACGGARLRKEALAVQMHSGALALSIADVSALTVTRAIGFFSTLTLTNEQQAIAAPILKEIHARLGFLASVGLEYLSLDRKSATLSGGEAQRIRLATQVGSGLVGVCYVLDEPTIGLHQRDNDRLLRTLRNLCLIGNSVIVVEHDEDVIRSADWLVDIGPGPGRHGGEIVAQGKPSDVAAHPTSLTGDYLAGRRMIAVPTKRRALSLDHAITVKGAKANNLKSVDAVFPLGGMLCVTGVSGSGKSTLVNDILLKALQKSLSQGQEQPGAHAKVTGLGAIDRVVEVDQAPIGRTPRSNPATYTGMFDEIRKIWASLPESKIRGYEAGRFSFNVKGGRCEACQGQGVKRIEMHFLPDVFVACETCNGKRYASETLEIKFKGKSIADLLATTIEDARGFFDAHTKIAKMLTCLVDVGLGYLELGQASTTLSGGEAQRIKLATELGAGSAHGRTLYILDEPTTGLHFADVDRLLTVLHRLADAGNTLVIIEHNLDVVKSADWIIDLGPEGGDRGGSIVCAGTPEEVALHPTSWTAKWLKPMLQARPQSTAPAAKSRKLARVRS
ncbi:MAG: excinuclease ABC subunit UvrA [Phycisphaerales bacterium]|nr:excinuclease ABC subunit UvrA [Phycisphaerales bacterium]